MMRKTRIPALAFAASLLLPGCAPAGSPVETRPPGSTEVVSPDVQASAAHQDGNLARLEGDLAFQAGKLEAAIKAYSRAASAHPGFRYLFFQIAQCYERQGLRKEAVAFFREYLAANPFGRWNVEAERRIATLCAEDAPK
ncbi:MAG: tetratricopeptide repeat protein [Planctomycetes bacterium]|nr:tetratricopeptide repeat protein [Planctomycetota bacterium]